MAITILLEPQAIQPAYNEIITVLDSTKKTEDEFQFVVRILVNGVARPPVIRQSPDPAGYGVVDLHKHIETALTYDIDHANTALFRKIPNSWCTYTITVAESYIWNGDLIAYGIVGSPALFQFTFDDEHDLISGDEITLSGTAHDGIQTVDQVIDQYTVTLVGITSGTEGTSGTAVMTNGNPSEFSSAVVFTGTKYAVNSVLPWVDVPTWDYTDYLLSTSTPGKLFTSASTEVRDVQLDDRFWMDFHHDTSGIPAALLVTTDNGVFAYANTLSAAATDRMFLSVGLGPWNIANAPAPTVISGSLPAFDDNTVSYTIALITALGAPVSQTYEFFMNTSPCTQYEKFRLLYLDSGGSFSNVTFDLASKDKTSVTRKTFKRNHGGYDPVTNTWGYDTWDRGDVTLDTSIRETFTINTNYVHQNTGDKVMAILTSPEVYHLDENGRLRAINVRTSSLGRKTRLIDRLINYTIDFEYAHENTVQRG